MPYLCLHPGQRRRQQGVVDPQRHKVRGPPPPLPLLLLRHRVCAGCFGPSAITGLVGSDRRRGAPPASLLCACWCVVGGRGGAGISHRRAPCVCLLPYRSRACGRCGNGPRSLALLHSDSRRPRHTTRSTHGEVARTTTATRSMQPRVGRFQSVGPRAAGSIARSIIQSIGPTNPTKQDRRTCTQSPAASFCSTFRLPSSDPHHAHTTTHTRRPQTDRQPATTTQERQWRSTAAVSARGRRRSCWWWAPWLSAPSPPSSGASPTSVRVYVGRYMHAIDRLKSVGLIVCTHIHTHTKACARWPADPF